LKKQSRGEWFSEARFGMFIHWGVYSVPARGEWVMMQEKIPPAEYMQLANRFRPNRYDPAAWSKLARDAGMKYMVLTTRHHDGFCLFDTKTTKFTSAASAAGRDLIAEYVNAVRKAGLKVGLYYSLGTWLNPLFHRRWTLSPKLGRDKKAWN
jgi:alpha-L-fucosidase